MRKYILLLMAFCLYLGARGQTGYEYDYWFDNNRQTLKSGSSRDGAWQLQIDVSGLREAFHAIHLQVHDSEGNHSSPVTRYFIKTAEPSIATGRYWFDDNVEKIYTSAQMQGVFDIDVSQLSEGFHVIHYQVVSTNNNISATATRSFYKVYMPSNSKWHSWFDNDETTMQSGTDMSQTLLLDVSDLTDGYHVLHIQVDGGGLSASIPITKHFVKIPQTIGVDSYTCLCMVDDQLFRQEKVAATGGVVEWNLDVSQLSQGFHRFFVQVVTPSGAASNTWQGFFLRETTHSEFAQMKCIYAIDGAEFYTEAGTLTDGTFHFDLDVSTLDDGLHRIAYMLSNGKGVTTKTQCQFFVKNPMGGNGITGYWYWMNENGDQTATKVALPERKDPFSLITLLPVAQEPIRSKLFQFRIEKNQPVIYAKNDIHIRFYDAAGRFTDVSKQYVDEREKQVVTDVTLLNSGDHKTTACPKEDEIIWYQVTAQLGDSLQFKLNRAASIQLFSPSGKELYSASGAESMKWGGCHAGESGTFYVALHDVTATYGNDISIEYEHIDKFAVFAYTPDHFSGDGTTIMHLEGNGLEFVRSVEMTKGETILRPDTIISNTTDLLVRFALKSELISSEKYDLNIFFDNGEGDTQNIFLPNAVTLEPIHKGDIAVIVSSEHRVGDPYPIKVTLKNNGNVGYYGIPVNIAIDDPEKVDEFRFVNFELLLSEELYNSRMFFTYTDNLVGTEKKGLFVPLLIPYLAPNEEKTLIFGIKTKIAHAKFNFYAWAGDPMYDGISNSPQNSVRRAPCTRSNIPDVYDVLDDADNLTNLPVSPSRAVRPFIGAAEAIAGIIQGGTRARDDATFDAYGIDPSERDQYRMQYRFCNYRSPHDIWRDANPLHIHRRAGSSGAGSIDSHASADCPKPNPHGTDVYIPGDPNEITGYLAESGSHYINDEISTVCYDIEFENDPKIANSSAHTIIIENQLDPNVFDLSSFTPKDITVGSKKVELSGEKSFVITTDLRTAIDAIAELRCDYNEQTGQIKWTLTSLDPNTMETTDDIMQGILPVNSGGNGIGHVTYSVDLKPNLSHGMVFRNKASIVFDNNDAIETPVWQNTLDHIAPESYVSNVQMQDEETATVSINATDELSGPWRYDVYVQYGTGSEWIKGAENVPINTKASVKVYEGINHGFYVVVTDSAGNVEQKNAEREFTFEVFGSQTDTNTMLDLTNGWNWISQNQQTDLSVDALKPKVIRIVGQTEELIKDEIYGYMGDLETLKPTQMYKVQMPETTKVQLGGRLFNAAFRSIPLYRGWNWIGYPVANAMSPDEALANLEAEEGDFIVGQDGIAVFGDGQWIGTMTEMIPGQGFMYKSASDKNLFYNATAQASSRQQFPRRSQKTTWTVDKRKYPNVMAMIVDLYLDDVKQDTHQWMLGAFCGDECRGVAQQVQGVLMMNVYGLGNENITFRVVNLETDDMLNVQEQQSFQTDVLGTLQEPYQLHIGDASGIQTVGKLNAGTEEYYDLLGRKVARTGGKGVYIVNDMKTNKVQKVLKK